MSEAKAAVDRQVILPCKCGNGRMIVENISTKLIDRFELFCSAGCMPHFFFHSKSTAIKVWNERNGKAK